MTGGGQMAEFLKTNDQRRILHVDLDAFYAQIEMRDNPDLKKVALIISRDPQESHGHGVVATANYEARKLGVHSAMSAAQAKRLAPDAVFLRPNFDKYRAVSQQIQAIFKQYTKKIERVALDEAYLDVTDSPHRSTAIAAKIRHQVMAQTSLTCSVGVSHNKLLAKLGSENHKPNGVTVINPEDVLDFIGNLKIADFRGVGARSEEKFKGLGIENGYQLRALSIETLRANFGKMGDHLYWQARGVHFGRVMWQRQRQSVGKEETFDYPLRQRQQISQEFKKLATKLVTLLQNKQLSGRTINVKIRDDQYRTINRSLTKEGAWPVDVEAVQNAAQQIFDHAFEEEFSIRLLGISFSNLQDNHYQNISLFDQAD